MPKLKNPTLSKMNSDKEIPKLESAESSSLNFLDEKDVFKILLNQMQSQLVLLKEQEISIVKGNALALIEGEEKERGRVSREIHDGIGQMLTAIKLAVNAIKDQEELKVELKAMIDDTISEIRRISFNLMPSVLLNFGLIPSVKILCENAERYGGLKVNQTYSEDILIANISFEKATTLYRIIQEALNNILKHANAKNVFIRIEEKSQGIIVSIIDDGDGFQTIAKDTISLGKGLSSMSQRAEISGGKCTIESETGKGTKIDIMIPF
jgi:two-component system NarL family sensor kinase